ncbi:MAG: thioredoxin family protein [Desulfovibrio sp.]|nr:thioredoxin family protein [Desulfovibrio sp.]
MSQKILGTLISFLMLAFLLPSGLAAADRHEDLPLATSWSVYGISQQARNEAGLEARRVAVLLLEPDDGWYTYAHDPGGFAKPTKLSASLGKTPLPVLYPAGQPKPDPLNPGAMVNAYAGKTPLFVLLPEEPKGKSPSVAAKLEVLLCTKDRCLPASIDLAYVPPKGNHPDVRTQPWWPALLAAAKASPAVAKGKADALAAPSSASSAALPGSALPQAPEGGPKAAAPAAGAGSWADLAPRYFQPELEVGGLFKAVLLGMLAGFILNFMPCVLPVISIKLSALMAGSTAGDAASRASKFREHNFFFALGILLYFLILSIVLGATGLAWGQIFQQPAIVLALTALIFALSLSLFGVFSLPIVDLKFDQMTARPRLQALSTGLLATLLATPCSGPFLGGVLGWTLMQPPWVISSVLAAVGAGMALPYLAMAVFPGMSRLLPKPGPWTGHLEKAVGLLLLATCIYLMSILPDSRFIPALILLWFTACAAWTWGTAGPGFDSAKGVLLKTLALALLAAGLWLGFRPVPLATQMEPYTEQSLRAAMGKETVVVDFTADWCPSCKVLEQTTLTPARLGDMKARYGLKLMRADLTEQNPEAEALLRALGSKSIPVLAIFPKNRPDSPLVLRDLFTPTQLEEALKNSTRQ